MSALVQQKAVTASGFTFAAPPTAGNLLVAQMMGSTASAITNVSDSVNGNWTRIDKSGASQTDELWYMPNNAGGNPTITVSLGRTTSFAANFAEFSGIKAAPLDTHNTNSNTATASPTSASITPSAKALIIASLSMNVNDYSTGPTGGFTRMTPANTAILFLEAAYKSGATGAQQAGWGLTAGINSEACIAAFLETPPPPTADFSGTPLSGTAPLAVQFTDLSAGTPTAWLWDFGDGDTDTAQNPTHTYAAAGVWDVSLTATNAQGNDTMVKHGYITSLNAPTPAPTGQVVWRWYDKPLPDVIMDDIEQAAVGVALMMLGGNR